MNRHLKTPWNKLENLAQNPKLTDLKEMFDEDDNRVNSLTFNVADLHVDLSKNWIDQEVLDLLIQLSEAADIKKKINSLFSGGIVNISECKSATHVVQRMKVPTDNILSDRQKMMEIAQKYINGTWLSAFGKKIKTVVNIGIGGSFLGPKLVVESLSELQSNNQIKILFYASVDSVGLKSILNNCDIEETLFCICSKSLSTIETSHNTDTIFKLIENRQNYNPTQTNQSFVAATANYEKAQKLNIPKTHVMPFDNATGGRFSVWSSIGFSVLMAVGETKFLEFLSGAEKIDKHLIETNPRKNIPVLMAMISIWYRNFMHLPAYAIIPYDLRLKHLPAWLQQLMMESNGKMLDNQGKTLEYSTSPWVFGDHGQLSQHAFFQAFHQGKDILPIDFIGIIEENNEKQQFLLVNMLAQSAALMSGNEDGHSSGFCPGNRPSTTILINGLSANTLGQVLALYENIVYVQSVIWNINCFDQPGVELGKRIANNIVDHMNQNSIDNLKLDPSTKQLLSKTMNLK